MATGMTGRRCNDIPGISMSQAGTIVLKDESLFEPDLQEAVKVVKHF